jgi:hypothetical protein
MKTIRYYLVKINRKHLARMAGAALIVSCAGCGGLSASKSISPASFFLPGGLLKAEPKQPPADIRFPQPEPVKQLALAQ